MGGGSAKPKRRKAAAAALRYEHRKGPSAAPRKKERGASCLFACLVVLGFTAFLVPTVMMMRAYGRDVWGGLAPAWPGGGYAFAATVGALVPVALGSVIAALIRMNWRESKVRSLGWAAAALPGLAACWGLGIVIGSTTRPKHRRDWDAGCYARGGGCWVHAHYPFVWAVGLVTALAVGALLVALLVRLSKAKADSGEAAAESSSPAAA
ncbi:hypothetical protein ACF1A5_00410 [Streptomyces sp. NPDC014864]|uniref:hypothetical protein n=1 Tax=Streptomyces sp. NPDC014864 TaxID=3364924 RepID=UPI0036F50544